MATQLFKTKQAEAGSVQWLRDHMKIGQTTPHAEVVTLTPGLAGVLLQCNPDNRNIRPVKVRHFASDMRAGRWPLNGETIIISKCGLLNDGGHRLNAIVDANVCIEGTIFFGAERETRKTIDQGSARGAGDYLAMDGVPHSNIRAAMTRMIMGYEDTDGNSIADTSRATNAEVCARARDDKLIGECAHFASEIGRKAKYHATASIIGAAYYLLARSDPRDALAYMTQIATGEDLRRSDPAYAVREKLLELGGNRSQKMAAIFRGWNAYRQGKALRMVKMIDQGLPALI